MWRSLLRMPAVSLLWNLKERRGVTLLPIPSIFSLGTLTVRDASDEGEGEMLILMITAAMVTARKIGLWLSPALMNTENDTYIYH